MGGGGAGGLTLCLENSPCSAGQAQEKHSRVDHRSDAMSHNVIGVNQTLKDLRWSARPVDVEKKPPSHQQKNEYSEGHPLRNAH